MQQIIESIITLDENLRGLNHKLLEDEILNSKAIQFILEIQSSVSFSAKFLSFYNSIEEMERNNLGFITKNNFFELMNSKSFFSLDVIKTHASNYSHLISNENDILFAIKFKQGALLKTNGFILFLNDSLIILHVYVLLKPTVTIDKLLYCDLPLGFMQFESSMLSSKLIIQYNQKELVFVCPSKLSELSQLFSVQ